MTDTIVAPDLTAEGTRVVLREATFRRMPSPEPVQQCVGQTGTVTVFDPSDGTVRVDFGEDADGDRRHYWCDPSGLDPAPVDPPYEPPVLRAGDRVVVESNLINREHNFREGTLGAQLIGREGVIQRFVGDGEEVVVRLERHGTMTMFRDSFLRVDDLDRLAEERSPVGRRVRVTRAVSTPDGDEDTMVQPVVGEVGVIAEPGSLDGVFLVGGLSTGHTDGHSLFIHVDGLEFLTDDEPEAPHVGQPEPEPTMAYGDALTALRAMAEEGLDEPEATVVRDLLAMDAQITDLVTSTEAERSEWEARMERLQERAREVADEEQWCGVFDRAMDTLGLQRRIRTIEISWRWEQTIETDIDIDDDDAEVMVASATGLHRGLISIPGTNSIRANIQISASGTIEAEEGTCICGQVDDEAIVANLSYDEECVLDNSGESIDLEGVTCDNCN